MQEPPSCSSSIAAAPQPRGGGRQRSIAALYVLEQTNDHLMMVYCPTFLALAAYASGLPPSDGIFSRHTPYERSSRWWFHTLNSSYTKQGTDLVRRHRNSCTGVYLYMDTTTTPSGHPGGGAGRFVIRADGTFHSATDGEIAERVQPYLELGVTVHVSLTPATAAILDGTAQKGIQAAVATAARHNLTGLMVDYEPNGPHGPGFPAKHEIAYASFLHKLAAQLHTEGLQLDMCVSSWSILTNFTLYQQTGVDRMMSMASTYSGSNATRARMWVSREIEQGVTPTQLAVGIGTVTTTAGAEGPGGGGAPYGYNWTKPEFENFVTWLEQRDVRHIDLWRSDLNLLSGADGTAPWIYSTLATFLSHGAEAR